MITILSLNSAKPEIDKLLTAENLYWLVFFFLAGPVLMVVNADDFLEGRKISGSPPRRLQLNLLRLLCFCSNYLNVHRLDRSIASMLSQVDLQVVGYFCCQTQYKSPGRTNSTVPLLVLCCPSFVWRIKSEEWNTVRGARSFIKFIRYL